MHRLGLVIPLVPEARALFGRGGWIKETNRSWRRDALGTNSDLLSVCSGPGRGRAAEAASWLVGQGASCLASIGIAGGLSPGLPPGTLILSSEDWDGNEGEGEGRWRRGGLACVDQALLTAEDKAALFRRSGALGVDQESAAVMAVAEAAGIPSFALRAVCDPADRAVPAALAASLGPRGNTRLLPLLAAMARRPALLNEALVLRADFSAALQALSREWRTVSEGFLAHVIRQGVAGAP